MDGQNGRIAYSLPEIPNQNHFTYNDEIHVRNNMAIDIRVNYQYQTLQCISQGVDKNTTADCRNKHFG